MLCFVLTGCGGLTLWPFGGDGPQGRDPAPPANATAYRCDGNRSFYLRMLEGGAAWVILPEREFRLDKPADAPGGTPAAAAGRYANGTAVLEIKGEEVSLTDGPGQVYAGCRIAKPNAAAR